jgi:crotonobetainyl-CoA:carnitine CoA-transferase CaiB-like acyl-CoA transferase
MPLLSGFRVAQLGRGLGAAVCGRIMADVGADVACVDPDTDGALAAHLNYGKSDRAGAIEAANLIVCEGGPADLRAQGHDAARLRALNATATLVFISPFGQTGPLADAPAADLTLFFASGISRLLTGQVDDLAEPPIRPVGEQSAFLGGLAAASAGMHAVQAAEAGAIVDVSLQEVLATLAMTELARAGLTGKSWSRLRLTDGNGATVCILPARD